MSLVHTIVFKQMMKSKVLYSPDQKTDHDKKRQEERKQTERIPLPKNVTIKESNMEGITIELVTIYLYEKLKARGQDCELYLRDHMMHQYVTTPSFPEAKKDLKTMKQRMDEVMGGRTMFGNRRIDLE